MPFHAQCSYCGQKSRVPDHMLGASGQCPKCTSYFTLVPAEEALVLGQGPPAGLLPKSYSAPLASSPQPDPGPEQDTKPEPGAGPILPSTKAPRPGELRIPDDACQKEKLSWFEPVSACALSLGAAGLLCALAYSLSAMVVPLSLAGSLLGFVGLLRALALGKYRLELPVAAPAVGGMVFLMALVFPSFLGPTYIASRAKIHVDPTVIRVIPLSGKPGSEPESPEWVDASQAALQQGRMRVQVVSVSIGPLETKPPPKKKGPLEEFLFIRLRSRQVSDSNESPVPGPETSQDENARPRLTDSTGKIYVQRDVRIVTPEEKGRKAFPMALVDQVFVFEVPSTSLELRFEIPAASWGGTGFFRFTIPQAMIRHDSPGLGSVSKRGQTP